jgi:hypothetical protein
MNRFSLVMLRVLTGRRHALHRGEYLNTPATVPREKCRGDQRGIGMRMPVRGHEDWTIVVSHLDDDR